VLEANKGTNGNNLSLFPTTLPTLVLFGRNVLGFFFLFRSLLFVFDVFVFCSCLSMEPP